MANIKHNEIWYEPTAYAYVLDRPAIQNALDYLNWTICPMYLKEWRISVRIWWSAYAPEFQGICTWIWVNSKHFENEDHHAEFATPTSLIELYLYEDKHYNENLEWWNEFSAEERFFDLEPDTFKKWTDG